MDVAVYRCRNECLNTPVPGQKVLPQYRSAKITSMIVRKVQGQQNNIHMRLHCRMQAAIEAPWSAR